MTQLTDEAAYYYFIFFLGEKAVRKLLKQRVLGEKSVFDIFQGLARDFGIKDLSLEDMSLFSKKVGYKALLVKIKGGGEREQVDIRLVEPEAAVKEILAADKSGELAKLSVSVVDGRQ